MTIDEAIREIEKLLDQPHDEDFWDGQRESANRAMLERLKDAKSRGLDYTGFLAEFEKSSG